MATNRDLFNLMGAISQPAVDAANRVLAGPYSMNPDWFANFRGTNNTSPEMIFVSARRLEAGISINFISDRLH